MLSCVNWKKQARDRCCASSDQLGIRAHLPVPVVTSLLHFAARMSPATLAARLFPAVLTDRNDLSSGTALLKDLPHGA